MVLKTGKIALVVLCLLLSHTMYAQDAEGCDLRKDPEKQKPEMQQEIDAVKREADYMISQARIASQDALNQIRRRAAEQLLALQEEAGEEYHYLMKKALRNPFNRVFRKRHFAEKLAHLESTYDWKYSMLQTRYESEASILEADLENMICSITSETERLIRQIEATYVEARRLE